MSTNYSRRQNSKKVSAIGLRKALTEMRRCFFKMKDIIIGFYMLFSFPSIIYFWYCFIHLEKTKQIKIDKEAWKI